MNFKKITALCLAFFALNSTSYSSDEQGFLRPAASNIMPLVIVTAPSPSPSQSSPLMHADTFVVTDFNDMLTPKNMTPLIPSLSAPSSGAFNERFPANALTKVSIVLNNVSHDLEINSIIALADRVVGNSTPAKRNLKPQVFNAIRDDLGYVRSILKQGGTLNMVTMQPVLESIIKNCSRAYHSDVNAMLGKLGLKEDELSVIKASLSNAGKQLEQERPDFLEGLVVCFCTVALNTIAHQLSVI
jgi:hypothetical protein